MENHIRRISFASSTHDIQALINLDLVVRAAKAAKRSRVADARAIRQHRFMSSISYSSTAAHPPRKSSSCSSLGVIAQAQRGEKAQAQAFFLKYGADGETSLTPLPPQMMPRMQPPRRSIKEADVRRLALPRLTIEDKKEHEAAAGLVRSTSDASQGQAARKRDAIFAWLRGVVRPRTDGRLPPMR